VPGYTQVVHRVQAELRESLKHEWTTSESFDEIMPLRLSMYRHVEALDNFEREVIRYLNAESWRIQKAVPGEMCRLETQHRSSFSVGDRKAPRFPGP
jgi:hypothetical protein